MRSRHQASVLRAIPLVVLICAISVANSQKSAQRWSSSSTSRTFNPRPSFTSFQSFSRQSTIGQAPVDLVPTQQRFESSSLNRQVQAQEPVPVYQQHESSQGASSIDESSYGNYHVHFSTFLIKLNSATDILASTYLR